MSGRINGDVTAEGDFARGVAGLMVMRLSRAFNERHF